MPNEEGWIDRRLNQAQMSQQSPVTDAVATRMTDLLKGKLAKAPLAAKEMAETARALVDDMVPPVASGDD